MQAYAATLAVWQMPLQNVEALGIAGSLLLYESDELRQLWMNLHLAP